MKTYTMTMTEGAELPHIMRFTLPLLFGNLFQQLYNIVDSMIVGRFLGADALASVGATGSLTYLFYTLCIGITIGAGILTAQYFGAGDQKRVKKVIASSAYVIFAFGLILTAAGILCAPLLLELLETPDTLIEASTRYMQINCAGTLAVAAYNWINSILRSLGNSMIPLVCLIAASVLNVGLDLLFVLVFGLGVSGAALATVISQAVAALSCIIFAFVRIPQFRFCAKDFRPESETAKKCVVTGLPIAVQNAAISVSMIYLQRTANTFGETVMAAYTATLRVEQLIHQPFASLGTALSTFTGQNMGAGKPERCIKGYRKSMFVMGAFSLLMLGVFFLCGDVIVSFFVEEPEVVAIGDGALRLSACFYFFLGMIYTTRGVLNGAGDVGYAMMNGLVEVAGRIGFATVLSLIPAIGWQSVWATSGLTWFITGVMSWFRYRSGKWRKSRAS